MKITYLKEAFGKIDKLKGKIDKKLTGEDIRREAMELMIQPILEDRDFLLKCGNCFKSFIHVNANTTPPGVLDFRYTGLKDGVLSVICDAHYTGNASQRNHATAKSVLIENELFDKMSVSEISEEIDDYVTRYLWQYFKKKNPDVLNTIKAVHVEKINLWSNCPESVNGVFPGKLSIRIRTEWYGLKMLSSKELSDLFDKVSKLFTFCAQEVILEKSELRIDILNSVQRDIDRFIELSDYVKKNWSQYTIAKQAGISFQGIEVKYSFDSATEKQLKRKDLTGYMPFTELKKIDFKKYLSTKTINSGNTISESLKPLRDNLYVISTASVKDIEKLKFDIAEHGVDIYNEYAKSSLGAAIQKVGVEYLAVVTENVNYWQGDMFYITDFINGKFNKRYELLFKKK